MQQKMQEEIALIRVEASAGGGMVTVKMDGHKNVHRREDRSGSGGRRRDAAGPGDGGVQRSRPRKWTKRRKRRWAACWAAWVCRRGCSKRRLPGNDSMPDFAEPLARLIDEFKRLPGIGQKSAQRLAFHVLRNAARRCRAAGAGAARRQRQSGHLRRVQQHQRRRAVPLLPRSASRSLADLRGGGAAQHSADRDHAPVQRRSITCCTARFRRCAASGRSS